MIYSIFIYSSSSGLLLWDRSFGDIGKGKALMLSSFLSAIKSFVSEMVIERPSSVETIDMGGYILKISPIQELDADLVIIADKKDEKKLKKIIAQLIGALKGYKDLFSGWNGDKRKFEVLNKPIMEILGKQKDLLGGENQLAENQTEILKTLWSHRKELPESARIELANMRRELLDKFDSTMIYAEKLKIIDKILSIDQKLKDEKLFLDDQRLKIKFMEIIEDYKLKIKYYTRQIKGKINEIIERGKLKKLEDLEFRDVYMHLYSLSAKIRESGNVRLAEKFRNMAKVLMDKKADSESGINLPDTVSYLLKLSENPDNYL